MDEAHEYDSQQFQALKLSSGDREKEVGSRIEA